MLLVDTNIWLAAADRRSDRHGECAKVLRGHTGELAAPVPVIAETSWLILDRLGTAAQATFIRLITSGQLTPVNLTEADWPRPTKPPGRASSWPRRSGCGARNWAGPSVSWLSGQHEPAGRRPLRGRRDYPPLSRAGAPRRGARRHPGVGQGVLVGAAGADS